MKPSDIIQASISRKIGHRHALNDIDYLKACCESIQEYLDEQYENAHDNSGNKPHGIFIGEGGLEKHLKSENQAFMHVGTEHIKVNEPKWPNKLNIDANGSRDLVLMNTGYNDAIDRCIKAWKDVQGMERCSRLVMNTKDKKYWIISKGKIIICIAAGCDDKAISNGYCWKHYGEFMREELEEE